MTIETYPTIEEVEIADQIQLATWYRFLRSPGPKEIDILNLIISRFKELGGMSPTISKQIGWDF